MSEKLIQDLVSRLTQELPFYNVNKRGQALTFLKQNEDALLRLSVEKAPVIAADLLHQLKELAKAPMTSEENVARAQKSQLYLLELLCQCLDVPWKSVRAKHAASKRVGGDANADSSWADLNINVEREGLVPPPLPEEVAADLFRYLSTEINKSGQSAEVQAAARATLFQLSASNYTVCIKPILSILGSTLSEEDISQHVALLVHMNHGRHELGNLILSIGKALNGMKKTPIQMALASTLRAIIWSWIDNFPWQFIALCQSGNRLQGNPDAVFDVFEGWASNTAKKTAFWPVCTSLLILCPDIMLSVVGADKGDSARYENKAKFLDALKKAIQGSKLADVAARCYVDFCTASTFVSKSDLSALRFIPPTVDKELHERLFNPSAPPKRPDGSVDSDLMVECLKSFFYMSPRKIVASLFADILSDGPMNTPLMRNVLIDTLLQVAHEPKSLEWNPTLSDIYAYHSGSLRKLFEDLLASVREYSNLRTASDKKGRAQFEKVQGDISLLIKLIKLFEVDPGLALFVKEDKASSEEVKRVLTGLSDCSIFYDIPELATCATKTLLVLFKPDNVASWYHSADDFWNTTSSITLILASVVIERSDLDTSTVMVSLTLLENILSLRNQFLHLRPDAVAPTAASKHIRLFASTNLESAFLIHLGSSDTGVVSKCTSICRLLCAEVALLRHCIDETDSTIVVNYPAYTQLADSTLSTGRQAQQKAIRTLLKRVDQQTPGNCVAWDEICFRWNIYTNTVKANEEAEQRKEQEAALGAKASRSKKAAAPVPEEGLPRILALKSAIDVFAEWSNYLGVLCSLNAVTISQGSGRAIGARALKTKSSAGPEEFLKGLMDLLVSEHVKVRENVKLMLGNASSPSVFRVLFSTLYSQAKQRTFSSDQAVFTPSSVLFVDQAISVVKLILETETDADSLSLLTGFEDLILLLVRYVRQLTISVNNLQIRYKFCGLLQSMMAKSNLLNFRQAFNFRMELVENIMEWTSEFATKESNIPADLGEVARRQVNKLIKELDVQVMQAISALLKALPLQGSDDEAKAQNFSRFFSFFTNLLTRCKKSPQTVLTPDLPEATIQCLSFLVTANIEHGIEYFLSMGYYEDYDSRSAFLRVLTNILKEGTDFDASESADKYYKLLELILDPELEVVLALGDVTPITEADKVALLLVHIFEANDKALDLLKAAIRLEVERTEKENTLFRLNSMATKLLSAYCKLIGKEFLQVSVGPQIKQFIQAPVPCELDPSRMIEDEDVTVNHANVIQIIEQFLADISSALPQCPTVIREICKFLREVVTAKFPAAGDTVIAGFIFLRYLCPAIVAPDGFGVVDSAVTDRDIRRGFVIITKVLQNLANRVLFTKEVFMQPMNSFIEKNMDLIRDLFARFATVPEGEPVAVTINFSEEQKEEDLGRFHFYLSGSLDKLSKVWAESSTAGGEGGPSSNLQDRVTTLLAQLGPPPELPKASKAGVGLLTKSSKKGANVHYENFMARMASADTTPIRDSQIYYASGQTESKVPVLYYIARQYRADIMEMDLFNYHLLVTTQPFFGKPYALVVDLAAFHAETQLPLSWCSHLATVLPPGAGDHLEAVYILYAGSFFKKFSKRIEKLVGRIHKKFVFCSSVSQLRKYIPEETCGLPADTTAIEKNTQSTFSKVMMTKGGQYNKKEVKLIMSNENLQIVTAKQHPILSHTTPLVDFVPVARISAVSPKDKNEFTLTYNVGGTRTAVFSSPASEQIIQQLTALKDRHGMSKRYTRTKTFQPSNVPGTLLNMALLNLTVRNYPLRIAAHNLLVALCSTFAFAIDSKLFEANDIAIPHNSKHFVLRISGELAHSEPTMTLEFLEQAIGAISNGDKTSRALVLDYIRPWLRNLEATLQPGSRCYVGQDHTKVQDILNLLVVLSFRESNDLGPIILEKVWGVLAGCPSLLDSILECLMARTHSSSGISQLGEKPMNCAEDIIVALASVDAPRISGKLVHLFLDALERSEQEKELTRLEQSSGWVRIEVFLRLCLTLSFENLLCVERYLAEIFHIIVLLFYSGDSLIRANVYSLFMNVIHSLLCSSLVHPDKLQTLRFLFTELQHLSHRIHFGVGGSDFSPYLSRNERDNKLDTMPITAAESVARSLHAVLHCLTPQTGSPFHARWLSLTSKAAFQPNPCFQPRALMTLGVICAERELITDELIHQLLSLLLTSLRDSSLSDDYAIAIIHCLAHLYEHLNPLSRFYHQMFWICAALLQLHKSRIYGATVQLMHSIVTTLHEGKFFQGVGLSGYCLEARRGRFESMLNKLDQVTGLNFASHFSFALAAHLLKGLRNSSTKAASMRLLTDIIDLCNEPNASQLLAYLAALMPMSNEDVSSNLRQIIVQATGEAGSQSLFNSALITSKEQCALLFAFLSTMLKGSEIAGEQLFIYRAFEDGVNFMPEVFPITLDVLTKKMEQVLVSNQSPDILASVLAIMESIYTQQLDSKRAVESQTLKDYLQAIRFSGLTDCDQFQSKQNEHILPVITSVLEAALRDP